MASFVQAFGLRSAGASSAIPTPNYGPAYLLFGYVWAYLALSSRTPKQIYGLDHNVSPREDLAKYGEQAVREGKVTRRQLDMLRRLESASANSIENYTFLVAGVLFATVAGVDRQTINVCGGIYTAARIAYGVLYVFVEDSFWSQMRGIMYWTGNVVCMRLLWKAWGRLSV